MPKNFNLPANNFSATIMRLHPQQKDVALYEEGFGDSDLLGRQTAGKRISELLERVEDPVVLAVDGAWGSGKSYFLKRWVGAHTLENGGTATTVYFDAFANDFLDDPLIGLTGAIGERLPTGKPQRTWKKAKKVVATVARPALRIAAAFATAGVSEFTGPLIDAAAEAAGKEFQDAAEAFWKREDGRRAAMMQFRAALSEITKDGTPLIIVVDELDRCRPDYALSVLEVVKHFFAVERVHFLFGVNLEALEQIVRVRYGSSINAGDYLKRFVSLSLSLPQHIGTDLSASASIHYFNALSEQMGIEPKMEELTREHLRMALRGGQVSLRDIERILTRLVLLPQRKEFHSFFHGYQELIVSLVLWQVLKPELFSRAMKRSLAVAEIEAFYGITQAMLKRQTETYIHEAYLLRGLWQLILTGSVDVEEDKPHFARSFSSHGRTSQVMEILERDYFGLFEIPEPS
ncbi:hypothetical protein ASC97_07680 [Rhizobium sp. Root1203]|uniref:KAP family P-loop NTPase fold protein n=1 Tax=Rhizobium sp. Root1203 TaxID=1736427 RepID=UPI0007111656|nr:P-loop NTPase fold protein [Rhizobium sp. Root1203]KQV28211.1 hypothetical protein ASC97_07680 [Rhizobium sp. Root1203]